MTKKIDARKINVLKIIVEEYIKTGDITGSKSLLKKYDIWVSSATIRGDMAFLEKMWLIYQPYNSAWRLPTPRWIRVFVDYLMEHMPKIFLEWEEDYQERLNREKIDDMLYLLVSKLTKTTWEITFATVPSLNRNYYLWLSNFLEKNSVLLWDQVYNVIKVLENKYNFVDLLNSLEVSNKVSVFIGEENIIPDLESYAMIVKKINIEWNNWYLGILGSLKMDYAFNIAALRNVLS